MKLEYAKPELDYLAFRKTLLEQRKNLQMEGRYIYGIITHPVDARKLIDCEIDWLSTNGLMYRPEIIDGIMGIKIFASSMVNESECHWVVD